MSEYNTQGFQNNYGPRTLRRKSLLIGINYEGQQSALRGCRQDVRNMVLPTIAYLPIKHAEVLADSVPSLPRLSHR